MTTSSMMATSDWQQVTDGTTSVILQATGGDVQLCDSATKPTVNAPCHRIRGWASITSPTVAWVRSTNTSPVMVIIT